MQPQMKLTSIKKRTEDKGWFTSPKSVLEQHIHDLQLLNQQQMITKLKQKKTDIMKQSQQVLKGCHQYFTELTVGLAQAQSRIRREVDRQTLDTLEQLQRRIEEISQNDHSYNSYSLTYHNFKLLNFSFSTCQQPISELTNFIEKCYTIQISPLWNQQSQINGSAMYSNMRSDLKSNLKGQIEMCNNTTDKIIVYESEFMTSNKKTLHHGNPLTITQRQFQLALQKFHQRQEKQMLLNERLKTKIKSLQETLSKKGLNIKELNRMTTEKNEKCSLEYWDLELDRVRGQNQILREEMAQISNKLIELVSENEGLKGEYRKLIQSNISIGSNQSMYQPSNTIIEGMILEQNSRIVSNAQYNNSKYFNSSNLINNSNDHRQYAEQRNIVTSQTLVGEEGVSGIYLHSNINETRENDGERKLAEAENKVQQLSLQLTKRLTQLQTLTNQLQSCHTTVASLQLANDQLSMQLKDMTLHNESLEHDYEVSCKKKFQLEEKLLGLKVCLEQEKEQNVSNRLAGDNQQAMIALKEDEIVRLKKEFEIKIEELKVNQQKKDLELQDANKQLAIAADKQLQLNTKIDSLTKQLKQTEFRSTALKQQLKRIHQVIASKQQQISKLTQTLYNSQPFTAKQLPFTASNQHNSLSKPKQTSTGNLKQTPKPTLKANNSQQQILKEQEIQSKYQSTKKQLTRTKKQLKQLKQTHKQTVKQVQNIKGQYNKTQQLLSFKLPQVNVKIQAIVKEMQKSKTMYNGSIKLNEVKLAFMKEKVQTHFSQLLSNSSEGKKANIIEQVNKYLEQLKSYANKKAEIKRLKEQLAQLKGKQTVNVGGYKFNVDSNNIQLQTQQLSLIQKSLLEDRLLTQKQMLEDKLTISEQQANIIKSKLLQVQQQYLMEQQQSAKLSKQLKKLQSTIANEQLQSQLRQTEIKVEKMQSEVKSLKTINKKLTEELAAVQQQLKKKKDHIANVKAQLTSSEEKIQELNLAIQVKTEEIEKQKRLLKDQATKEMLLGQMKEKLEDFAKLEQANEELKKQLEKTVTAHRFQLSKVQTQLVQLKIAKAEELQLKITQRTTSLIEQLNDLKTKNKKLKSELQRKESLGMHLKTKQSTELNQMQQQLSDTQKQLSKRTKELENQQKKNDLLNVSFKKFKQKAKLLSIALEKVYTKILNSHKLHNYRQPSTVDNPSLLQNTLLQNTSPISRFPTSPHKTDPNPALSTLAQLDINFEDLEKYSEGLEMFGLNASELRQFTDMKTETFVSTQNCFSSPVITKNGQNMFQTKKIEPLSPSKTHNFVNSNSPNDKVSKGNLTQLTKCLSENQEVDLNQIMTIFDQALHTLNN